jgi:hypothetical protein
VRKQHTEQPLGLGGSLPVHSGQQLVTSRFEQLTAGLLGVDAGLAQLEQQAGSLGVVGWPQLQRSRIPAGRGGEGVQRQGPIAGVAQSQPSPLGQPDGVLPGRPGIVKRGLHVVGE